MNKIESYTSKTLTGEILNVNFVQNSNQKNKIRVDPWRKTVKGLNKVTFEKTGGLLST